jgi:hypothetical protein
MPLGHFQVKTKLAGAPYNAEVLKDHYCRIAMNSLPDCRYWSEVYTGCSDLRTILRDEAAEPATDDSSDSDELLSAVYDRIKAKPKKK